MFCPITGVDCVGKKCLMWDTVEPEIDEKTGTEIPVTEEQNCLHRVKIESEIDFYIAAGEVMENGLPGLPQVAEPPPDTPPEEQPPDEQPL
jgi:hypothetical protein